MRPEGARSGAVARLSRIRASTAAPPALNRRAAQGYAPLHCHVSCATSDLTHVRTAFVAGIEGRRPRHARRDEVNASTRSSVPSDVSRLSRRLQRAHGRHQPEFDLRLLHAAIEGETDAALHPRRPVPASGFGPRASRRASHGRNGTRPGNAHVLRNEETEPGCRGRSVEAGQPMCECRVAKDWDALRVHGDGSRQNRFSWLATTAACASNWTHVPSCLQVGRGVDRLVVLDVGLDGELCVAS